MQNCLKILNSLKEGVQIIDFAWRYLYVNDTLLNYQNTSREKIIGRTLLERFPGFEDTHHFLLMQRCMIERTSGQYESEFIYPDSTKRWFDLSIEPIKEGIMILSYDITARKEAEEKLKSKHHLFVFQGKINHNIVRVKNEASLFSNACRLAIEFGNFTKTWIGLFDTLQERIHLVEQFGIPEEDIPSFYNTHFPKNGPTDQVLRTGGHFICNDLVNLSQMEGSIPFLQHHDIRSCIVLPIKKFENVIGTFNLYSNELNFLEKEEIDLLIEIANDISYALDRFEAEKKQKLAEELVIKSEKRYHATLDHMLEGAQMHDFDWKYIYVNETLAKFSQSSREELMGFTLLEKYPGIDQTPLFHTLNKCMTERISERFETEFVFPDGSKAHFELSVQPVPEGLFILSVDVTERKNAKENLQKKIQELSEYKFAIDEAGIVAITDQKGIIQYVNDNFCKISKYSGSELIGQDHQIINSGFHSKAFIRDLWTTIANGKIWRGEMKNKAKDGSIYWVDTTIVPFLNELGKPYQYLAIRADITERKKNQEELEKANRMFALLSAVNQSIVHTKEEEELVIKACDIAENIGKFKMAYVGLVDKFNKLNLTCFRGDEKAAKKILKFSGMDVNDPILDKIPTGKVLRTGRYALNNDVQNDPAMEHWKEIFAEHKLYSNISLPIIRFGRVVGIIGLHSSVKNFFDDREISLLEEAAGDISFAFELFEKNRKSQATEELVLHNEKRFRVLIEKSADMKTLSNRDGELIYGSPSVTKVLGFTQKEYVYRPASSFIHPDHIPHLLENRTRILENPGASFYFQYRFLHKDCRWIWCEGTLTNMLHEDGIYAFVTNFRDISDKKAAEEQMEFDRNNLNALINNTQDLMWSVDREYNMITSNRPFDDMMRHMTGKIIEKGESMLSFAFSSIQSLRFKTWYERSFAGEVFTEIEHSDLPKEMWSEISFYPIRKGEEIVGTACYSRDITERKIAEQMIQKSERFNRGILRSLDSHIAVINEFGKIIAVNEAWKRFGMENGGTQLERVAEGSNYFEVCERSALSGDQIAKVVLEGMKEVLEEKRTHFQYEYPCHSPNEQLWFGMRVRKFDSEQPMIVAAHQDISDRKFIEEKLIHNNQELQKTNFELDRFVYSASHDLRSPLTSILGLVNLIEEMSKETETVEFAKLIRSSILRLDGFIKNILNYSRNNRSELEISKIPLQHTVESIIESLRNTKEAEGIRFTVDINELQPFYSDEFRLTVVLANLISNAIKFHDEGKSDKFIRIVGNSTTKEMFLKVEDNGIGILAKYHQKIFDMFFRLANKTAGSGVGLYIVKETVEKLVGSIQVESEEEKGTYFTLHLKNYSPS